MKTSDAGIRLIKKFEGCELAAYFDTIADPPVWTIGYGDTLNVHPGMTITQDEAERRLADRLAREFEPGVMAAIGNVPATQTQFDAMVSLAYNVGVGRFRDDPRGAAGFKGSSVAKYHRDGNYAAAGDAFLLWNHAGGQVNKPLTRRREAERALYLTGATDVPVPAGSVPAGPQRSADLEMLAAWVELGQRMLVGAGFDPGAIDGVFGPKTIAAIESWQSEAR